MSEPVLAGLTLQTPRQVIGGEASEPGEFPWAALLGQVRGKRRKHNGRLLIHTFHSTI